jgi:hypothetical protein
VVVRTNLRPDLGVGGPGADIDVPDGVPTQAPVAPDPAVPAAKKQAPSWKAPAAGQARRRVDPDLPRQALVTAKRLQAMPPGQRAKQLAEMKKKRDAIGDRIDHRMGVLDDKWHKMSPTNRENTLRDYAKRSKQLPPEKRAELMEHVDAAGLARARAAKAQERLTSLKAKGAPQEDIAQAKSEVQAATAEQQQAVDAASQVVDDPSLNFDFLSVAESAIDPAGMAFGSLFEMFDDFCEMDFGLSFFGEEIHTMQNEVKTAQKDERRLEDIDSKRDLEDAWRHGDDLKRRMMGKLGTRYEERRHHAGRVARGEARE